MQNLALKYSDVCLIPNYSQVKTRANCNAFTYIGGQQFKLPVIPANMKTVIDQNLARWMSQERYFYIMHRFGHDVTEFVRQANGEDWQTISISLGVQPHDEKVIEFLREEHPFNGKSQKLRVDYITIDIAHGYCEAMRDMIRYIREALGDSVCVIAGNVCTSDAVKALYEWGADYVKVGVGQGSPCTTKDKTGFTLPMFTCVQECAKANVPIIADGGVRCNGDIAKALVAGAKLVMIGGLFAQCVDSPAETVMTENGMQKIYYGSASVENKGHDRNVEGIKRSLQPNNMSVENKLQEIKQDLQSSISYAGGGNLLGLNSDDVMYRIVTPTF